MGIKDLQEYLETHCSSACLSVDLLTISRSYVPKRRGRVPGNGRFSIIVDAESCLDRLYGGYFSDWVCGGQWNRMLTFLSNLQVACQNANMELVVFFNGALESQRIESWYSDQVSQKKKVNLVLRHINNKGTPPPKVWWNPPVFLCGALRLALRQLGIGVAMSMDDHPQEVIGFCREHGLQGILGQNSVYAIFDPPRYFSCQNLKLTYKGSLETKEYVMDEMAKSLDLNPNRFCLFAALLGNHILTEDDLYEFFKDLIAHASTEAGKVVKPSPENITRAVVDYVRSLPDISNLDFVGEPIFRNKKTSDKSIYINKLKQSVQYYFNGTEDGFLRYNPPQMHGNYPPPLMQSRPQDMSGYIDPRMQNGGNRINPNSNYKHKQPKTKVRGQEHELPPVSADVMRIASERHQKGMLSPWIYQLLSQGEVKMVVTLDDENSREFPTSVDMFKPIRQALYSVLLNLNKLKYLHEQDKEKGIDAKGAAPKSFEVPVKEWVVRKTTGNTQPSFDLVMAKPVEWKAPSIERMWLGQQQDDKTRRLKAFLTIMHSDSPLMLNTNYVPQHLLILCCILRYMLQYGRTLQRQDLDAFLAMSVSPLLQDVQTMQDLKLPSIAPCGVALATLFMAGVETAIFANDVCGAPIPWNMGCPWQFYDGKLFHFKLLKANNNTPLIDMCDGQVDQVLRVERMRQAIMEGVQFEFAKPFLPSASLYAGYQMPYGQSPGGPFPFRPAGMPLHQGGMPPNQQYQQHPAMRGMGPPVGRGMGFMGPMGQDMGPPGPQNQGRGRGILGRSPVDGRGGQLEIAGVVVGSWGPNLSRGRGGRGGNPISPRVMSVGGPRRGNGRGFYSYRGMPMRPMRGGRGGMPMPPIYGMPERNFYPARGGRGAVRGTRRPAVRARPKPGGKTKKASKGRGMTVATSSGDSDVANIKSDEEEEEENGDVDDDVDDDTPDVDTTAKFDDADDDNNIVGKQLMQNGIQSPDSGIHGDKSGTDLTLSA